MMLFKIISLTLISAGGVIMALAAFRYHKLLEYYKQEVYHTMRSGHDINRILLYLFIFAFIMAGVDCMLRDTGVFYMMGALAFSLGALYVFFSVRAQASAAVMLREKSLEASRAFVNTIDLKEFHSQGHSKQVYDIVNLFYDELADYQQILNREKLLDAAILHDIGKINISAEVLSKRDRLSPEEWELIKSHPRRGKEMLDETCFAEISEWVLCHHERVDGNGYYGVLSENIPLEAKIISLADAYSALRSSRAYRPGVSHNEAMGIISGEAGKQFDRKLVECFKRLDQGALEKL
jgi:HD-GYP domain-containing protein (c-di-GMP phosphodiesterase class II)